MRRASLAVALALLAACHHAPPDKEARVVERPPEIRRVPLAGDLEGAWISRALRGRLSALGHTIVYVFAADGAYTGAIVGDAECTPIGGSYELAEDGGLVLDEGALAFRATLVDARLELASEEDFLDLTRLR